MNDNSDEPEVSYRRLPKNLREDRPPSSFNLLTTSGESQVTRLDENDILSSKGGSVPRQSENSLKSTQHNPLVSIYNE